VLFGGAVGVNLGRYAGIELSVENRELTLHDAGIGTLGEYALFPILLQGRLRYPLLQGRLEPYVIGGAGIELAELNDSSDAPAGLHVSADDQTLVGAIGGGLEYFVTENISIAWELKYVISRGHELQLGHRAAVSGNLDSLFLSIGVRAYLFEL
jgi:opacity protein-like surface antigen